MNKRYIDFVPSKTAKKTNVMRKTAQRSGVSTARTKSVSGTVKKPMAKSVVTVPKKNTAKEAKSKRVGLKDEGLGKIVAVEKPVEKSVKTETVKSTMKIPQTPFINQNKVEKRPLSKNVYRKKIEATVEPVTGPVTIISKPEKDRHVSVIVTIIITIILGAAAGTVAFLLLPK